MRDNKKRPGSAATPLRAGEKQTFTDVTTNPAYKRTTSAPAGQRSIADLLAVGAENGLTSRQLSQLTGLDTRTIQARISAERLSGVPICSDTLNGFYMPSNDEEKARCIRSLRRRGIEILRVAEAMNRIPGDGQMELETVEAEK